VPISRRQQSTELVGRGREIDALERAIDRVSSGAPCVLEIVGEPGVGKSTLLAELARRAAGRGFLVLDGRAAEFERDIPFGLMVDALNDYAGALEPSVIRALDEESLTELASILPSLSTHATGKTKRRPDTERYRVHYAIRALLERLAMRHPVLLSLDDVHWADAASLEVIAHLLRRFRGPLLGAVAVRHAPTQVAAALENVARVGSGVRLELQPLTEQEARELMDPRLDTATRAMIFRESGGNPFYLEQLARAQFAIGPAKTVSAEHPAGSTFLPAPVLAALEGELDALTTECRRVLEAAAVAGESFEPELVAAIADCDVAFTLGTLDELLRVDLIRPTGAPRRFRFRHPIVRRAVYDAMPGGWQISAHARAADALAVAGAQTRELAHHVERSASIGDEEAIALLVDAARDAAPRAPATAGQWLLAAADLLPPAADRQRRAGVLGDAARALTSAGAYEDSLASAQEALSLTPSDEVEKRAELIAMLAYARRRSGHPFDSRASLEQALGSLASPDGPAGLSVQLELALDRLWHEQFGPMLDLTERFGSVARDRGDTSMISLSASLSSLAHSSDREVEDALADLTEAQEAYARVSDDQLAERIYVSFYVALAAERLERADDALAHLNRGLEVARMTGQAATVIPWTAIAASALLLQGRVREAADVAATAIDEASLSRNDFRTVWALEADALAAYWAGNSERALASAREMVRRSGKAYTFLSDPARIQLAAALCAAGDHEAAAAELTPLDAEPTRRLLDLHAAHGWDLLVQAQLALGDVESARRSAARAAARASSCGLPCQLAATRCCEAAVSLACDDRDAALAIARDACKIADAAANPLLSARGRALSGLALAADGRRDQALPELQHAERALSACGATREADAAARELRRLGARVRRARPRPDAGLAGLTARESEIANRVALGESNREIANALFLSEKTVESHLVRTYAKLGVHSRSALTAIVVRNGRRVESSANRDFSASGA
jgi:DNA-binding CsgD family transcriptional regulator